MNREKFDRISAGAEKTAVALVVLLVFLFMLYLTGWAFVQTSVLSTVDPSGEHIEFTRDNVFLNIIVQAILLAAGYLFFRHGDHVRVSRMENALMFWLFAFGTVFIATTKLRSPVFSDSFFVTYGAQRAALGDYAVLEEGYFYRFPFQLGYVLYSEIFIRVFNFLLRGVPEGYAVLALQEMNLFWLMLEYHALIEIAKLLFKDVRIHKMTILLLFFCLPPVFTTTFLYGNIPAFSCGSVAVWMFLCYMKKGGLPYAVLSIAFLTLAVTLKLNLLIVCVAVGAVWLLRGVKKRSREALVCLLLGALCVLTLPNAPQKLYEKRVGVRYGDGIPMIAWMAMGFSEGHAAPGWYREDHTVTAFERSGRDPQATAENARQVLAERTAYFGSHPREALRFFSEKLRSQWNEPSYGSLWVNRVFPSYSEKGALYRLICESGEKVVLAVMDKIQLFVYISTLAGLVRMWRKRDLLRMLLPLILLGGLSYHLLFEAKSQYAMPYFVLMMPIAAYGLFALFRRVALR